MDNNNCTKYILEFFINRKTYITLWGADLTDCEKDKFLIDSQKSILLFGQIGSLKEHILNPKNFVFDSKNSKEWALNLEDNFDAFSIIDIDAIRNFQITSHEDLFGKKSTNRLIDFLNFFGDYAFQTNSELLLSLFRDSSIQFVIDYNYDTEFWESDPIRINELKLQIKEFNLPTFEIAFSRIRSEFIKRIRIIA